MRACRRKLLSHASTRASPLAETSPIDVLPSSSPCIPAHSLCGSLTLSRSLTPLLNPVRGSRPPFGGTLDLIYTAPAVAVQTSVRCRAGQWSDDAEDLPLSYSFAYASQADASASYTPLGASSYATFADWSMAIEGAWLFVATISDTLGATANASSALTVLPVAVNRALVTQALGSVRAANTNGDGAVLMQSISGIAAALNSPNTPTSLASSTRALLLAQFTGRAGSALLGAAQPLALTQAASELTTATASPATLRLSMIQNGAQAISLISSAITSAVNGNGATVSADQARFLMSAAGNLLRALELGAVTDYTAGAAFAQQLLAVMDNLTLLLSSQVEVGEPPVRLSTPAVSLVVYKSNGCDLSSTTVDETPFSTTPTRPIRPSHCRRTSRRPAAPRPRRSQSRSAYSPTR